ncbi:MAG: HAMP domain-containing protein [Clostridia bacterium]|nr:HAMP domain-containing protein [Clostridia bacterium]MCR4886537.1 cell wall metabolism sensor histidine kinase WalK [Clostridiales bacterium]
MAGSLSSMVGDSLFEQRIRADRASLETLASRISPLMARNETAALRSQMIAAGGELEGRVLLLDRNGKVQLDSYGEMQGERLQYPEIANILVKGQNVDYGVHEMDSGRALDTSHLLFTRRTNASWVGYCTAGVVHASDIIGVLLLVSPVQEMMQNVYQLQDQMAVILVAVAAAALICSWIFSRVITRPIAGLTRGIRQMSKGDFSSRVKVRGSGEMRQLALAFNSMSEKLETLDQSRNQFVSNASHELKTPLATMKIMIESLIYQPDMDKNLRTEFMTDINSEIDRLSAIVSDLLTLVQMDSQNVKLTRENLSIAQLVKENAHRLQPIADQKGQKILLSLTDPCDMYADKNKLNQVIYNLMENAVKYTQAGGQVKVTLQRQGRDARLTVADNGPGIPKESLPHIFDRFYRVDKARSREKGGTGLGLSIVHQLVLLHGGSIRVESEEGSGASFIVELPLHQGS